ncbi:uncharacterized protein LOC134105111 isoform X2 [Pungitius pungitius]|uniref:uncharacterized protein LOC134105111 isoform X2 n=1 Tax=Pungitius pungitius TaxID=134920 RepID=UPI002E15C22F
MMGNGSRSGGLHALGGWKCMGFMVLISIAIVWGILWFFEGSHVTPMATPTILSRTRRDFKKGWPCDRKAKILRYVRGSTTTFEFDLCDVIHCYRNHASWTKCNLYLCADPYFHSVCARARYLHKESERCGSWGHVAKYTGANWAPYGPYSDPSWWSNVTFSRKPQSTISINRVSLTLAGFYSAPPSRNPKYGDFYFTLGLERTGEDAQGILQLVFVDPPASRPGRPTPPPDRQGALAMAIDYSQLKPLDILEQATGYKDDNLWLRWLSQNAVEHGQGNCIACASGRPQLTTEPAPLHPEDAWGYNCMLGLTRQATPPKCTTLASLFPPIHNKTKPGPFTPYRGEPRRYQCFNFTHTSPTINVGQVPADWCNITTRGTLIGVWARAGLYYYCGGQRLLSRIQTKTIGRCAMIQLAVPLTMIRNKLVKSTEKGNTALTKRRRRHVLKRAAVDPTRLFDPTYQSPTYIDALGVPRGVPNEYKLANQIAAGFENIPLLSAYFPVTPNKNVDRINYVHYNVLRLSNLTRDAVEGLSEQLAPTSLMAVQNRMALDMLLAEKGGVCAMFGDVCCPFIPNNTAPDGSVARALSELKTLSAKMHEHSGVDNSMEEWMTKTFGKWKSLMMTVLLSLATFVGILVTCGCCFIPCARALCLRLISTAIQPEGGNMMPLLALKGVEDLEEEVDPADLLH